MLKKGMKTLRARIDTRARLVSIGVRARWAASSRLTTTSMAWSSARRPAPGGCLRPPVGQFRPGGSRVSGVYTASLTRSGSVVRTLRGWRRARRKSRVASSRAWGGNSHRRSWSITIGASRCSSRSQLTFWARLGTRAQPVRFGVRVLGGVRGVPGQRGAIMRRHGNHAAASVVIAITIVIVCLHQTS